MTDARRTKRTWKLLRREGEGLREFARRFSANDPWVLRWAEAKGLLEKEERP